MSLLRSNKSAPIAPEAQTRRRLRVLCAAELLRPEVGVAIWRDGREYVVWTDGEGRISATASRCPHRGASFAGGKVIQGQLSCPLHGWRFDSHGVHVFRPDGQPLTQTQVRCYELTAHDGQLYFADDDVVP